MGLLTSRTRITGALVRILVLAPVLVLVLSTVVRRLVPGRMGMAIRQWGVLRRKIQSRRRKAIGRSILLLGRPGWPWVLLGVHLLRMKWVCSFPFPSFNLVSSTRLCMALDIANGFITGGSSSSSSDEDEDEDDEEREERKERERERMLERVLERERERERREEEGEYYSDRGEEEYPPPDDW